MSEDQALEKNKEEYEALNENISKLNANSPTKQITKLLTRGLKYIRVIGWVSMLRPLDGTPQIIPGLEFFFGRMETLIIDQDDNIRRDLVNQHIR